MMEFQGRAILLDVEGTTSSIRFVYDVMFPYVRRELNGFLRQHWDDVDVQLACDQIARDAGHASLEAWCGSSRDEQQQCVEAEVVGLMEGDVKVTGLKRLQGLIWRAGFEGGEMKAHVYEDVPRSLRRWRDRGMDIRVYSSGSVQAQLLFFGHTEIGNLLSLFSGHYDTTVGGKKDVASYQKISADWKIPATEILFLSDVVAELDAAAQAGLQTGLLRRPGNPQPSSPHRHPELADFDQVTVASRLG